MKTIFDISLAGELDQAALDKFQKLLNLEPAGRLADTEDGQFGHRSLRDVQNEWVWLNLWRYSGSCWTVTLTYAGIRPPNAVIAQCQGEVLAAAGAVGVDVAAISSDLAEPVPPMRGLVLPTRRALSVRLGDGERTLGWLEIDTLERLRRALRLRRELRGTNGKEFGWRYVRWDPPTRSQLLQLYDSPDADTEVAVLFDRQPPSEEVVAGCRLQIEFAAAQAGLAITQQHPRPTAVTTPDWDELARRAAGARTFVELLRIIGTSDITDFELTRGRLLAVTNQPGWTAASPLLRRHVEDFMLGIPVDMR